MKRKANLIILSVIAALTVVATTACGSSGNANNGASSASPSASATVSASPSAAESASPSASASAEPATKTFVDGSGKPITVPVAPQKIAAVNFIGDLLALGVKPTFTTDYQLDTYGAELAGTTSLGNRPVNVENVLSQAPDLIITDDTGDASESEQLAKIAPTVSLTFWTTDPFEHLNKLAELLGKQQEAAKWLADYNDKVAKTKEQIQSKVKPGDTALLLILSGQDMGISGIRNGGFTLYRQLGFTPPKSMEPLLKKDENFGWETVSLEALPTFDADHLFVEMDDTTQATQDAYKKLLAEPVWKSLKASKAGHVYEVTNKWGIGDALALSEQLDEAIAQIAK